MIKTHGLSSHTLYILYQNIKYKCKSRDISICDRWKLSFDNFYADLLPTFIEGNCLHRINLDQGFFPDNVCWKEKPRIRNKKPFSQTKDKINKAVKVIETLNNVKALKDNKDELSLVLQDIIDELKNE